MELFHKLSILYYCRGTIQNCLKTLTPRWVNEMKFCWEGYKSQAWGYDDIKPVSGEGKKN